MKGEIACLPLSLVLWAALASNQSFAQNDQCNGPASYVEHAKNQVASSHWDRFESTLTTIRQARCVGTQDTCRGILDFKQDAINSAHPNVKRMVASYDELWKTIQCK